MDILDEGRIHCPLLCEISPRCSQRLAIVSENFQVTRVSFEPRLTTDKEITGREITATHRLQTIWRYLRLHTYTFTIK